MDPKKSPLLLISFNGSCCPNQPDADPQTCAKQKNFPPLSNSKIIATKKKSEIQPLSCLTRFGFPVKGLSSTFFPRRTNGCHRLRKLQICENLLVRFLLHTFTSYIHVHLSYMCVCLKSKLIYSYSYSYSYSYIYIYKLKVHIRTLPRKGDR